MGTHLKHLGEALLMSTHNICFHGEIRKYQHFSHEKSILSVAMMFCLFVLRFYGPVNPMGSCRARSVYLTTRLLGRLSPLSG